MSLGIFWEVLNPDISGTWGLLLLAAEIHPRTLSDPAGFLWTCVSWTSTAHTEDTNRASHTATAHRTLPEMTHNASSESEVLLPPSPAEQDWNVQEITHTPSLPALSTTPSFTNPHGPLVHLMPMPGSWPSCAWLCVSCSLASPV